MQSTQRVEVGRQARCERKGPRGRPRAAVAGLALVLLSVSLPTPAAAAATYGWQGATPIELDNGGVFDVQVGADAYGNFLAMWYQFGNLYSNQYTAGQGWGTAGLVETNDTAFVRYSSLAVGGGGDAMAAWVYPGSGGPDHVYANHFGSTTGWGLPVEIHPGGTGYVSHTSVAVNGAGTAFAVWEETGGGFITDIWGARFTLAGGWEPPATIDTGADYAYLPEVVVDDAGNALVVWQQVNGTYSEVMAAWYSGFGTWDPPQTLAGNDSADEVEPQLALSAAGDALVVWNEIGTEWNILASSYIREVGWQAPVLVEHRDVGRATSPRVAMDAFDNGCAVWLEMGLSGERDAWQNCYSKGVGWGQEALLEHEDTYGLASGPPAVNIAMAASGEAIATWAQSDGVERSAWAATRASYGAWGDPTLLETVSGGAASIPAVAMSSSIAGMAVWGQDITSNSRVMANRYVVLDTIAPPLFVGGPDPYATTQESSVEVWGRTEDGARVSVNGVEATVSGGGYFFVRIALAPGDNLIQTTATDETGNSQTEVRVVTFNDPVVQLASNLSEAQAQVEALETALNASQADLNATQANLTAAEAEIVAAEQDITAAEANVSSSQAAIAALQADVVAAETNLAAANAQLTQAQAQLTTAQGQISSLETARNESAAAATRAQAEAQTARDTAGGASGLALLGVLLGIGGLGVGAFALMRGPRGGGGEAARGWQPAEKKEIVGEAKPPKPE